MKKLILALALAGIATLIAAPAAVAADTVETIHMAARGPACNNQGYMSPNSLTVSSGELVTLKLKNEQPTKLDVVGLPGGTFTVIGNSTVEKSFTLRESLKYSIWLETQDCMKAEARIEVQGQAGSVLIWAAILIALAGGGYAARKQLRRSLPRPSRNGK